MGTDPQRQLPQFVPPMLASMGEPFDDPGWLYEIKWDGTRALAFIEQGSYRLLNRRRAVLSGRYPELACLGRLPAGTVLDGEIVVLKGGMPDFPLLLRREQATSPRAIAQLARSLPVTYLVFDLLYDDFEPIVAQPLHQRRQRLREILNACPDPRVVLSEGVVGDGRLYFEQATRRGLEGVMAKRISSPYRPGRRSGDWLKLKRRQEMLCAIIGYVPDPERGLKSLIIAAHVEGELRCVGKVGSGIGQEMQQRLLSELERRRRDQPVIACKIKGRWVEPGLFCTVAYLEVTADGQLRAPAFKELHVR